MTACNLESDWLNLGGLRSIPRVDSDLRHDAAARTAAHVKHPLTAGWRTIPATSERRTPAVCRGLRYPARTVLSCRRLRSHPRVLRTQSSSVRSRSARPSPRTAESVTIGDFSESTSLDPPHSPSPQPALTSADAPRHLCEVAGRCRTGPGKAANRDTSPQKRQACADVAAAISPAAWHA